MIDTILNLQFFADSGTLMNATVGYVNAYDGSTHPAEEFDTNNDLRGELKDFYDTELLENTRVELYYSQFGKKQRLPKGHGGRVEWRKFNTFPRADQLLEGVR